MKNEQQPTDVAGLTYADWFSIRARDLHGTVAARFLDQDLSYADLNLRANRLAHFLQSLGVGPEVVVAVSMERSLELLVALLAVWKAGGAFLPLDPDYPGERLSYLLRDAQPPVLLTQSRLRERFAAASCRTICVDDGNRFAGFPAEAPNHGATEENLAYLLYTSGSTGLPKGVEITHRAVLSHNLAISRLYELGPQDRVLQFASFSFDVALEELFPSWLCGSAVVLRTAEAISSARDFLGFVEREKISILNLPTAYWHDLVSELSPGFWPESVRLVIIGGERASEQVFARWKQIVPPAVKLINAYGPTEGTITATAFEADRSRDALPIGKPISNTIAAVLDESLRPVPTGALGELYLGGAGLARGYWRLPELTAQRFIPNPHPELFACSRLYRTGDLVRVASDGNFEFAGRVDDQVKVRGFRIEPGEIETALQSFPGLKEAVVAAREEHGHRSQLVAYVVPHSNQSASPKELMRFLRERLPAYMVPSQFVILESLPKTTSGKIDRRALPTPQARERQSETVAIPARSSLEQDLATIWQNVLGLNNVGITDDFFELGGDSLLALRIVSRVRERFGIDFALSRFLAAPNIVAIAEALPAEGAPQPAVTSITDVSESVGGPVPASFIQQQLFFLHELDPRSDAYHMTSASRIRGALDIVALEGALNAVVARHEALRTRLEYVDGQLTQSVSPELQVPIPLINLAHQRRSQQQNALRDRLATEARRPFDLAALPLFRVSLFRLSERDHVLLLVIHHAIADGWSISLLLRELQQSYLALTGCSGTGPLPAVSVQYSQYARWQRQWLHRPEFQTDLAFWRDSLTGAPRAIEWPSANTPPETAFSAAEGARRSAVALPAGASASASRLLRTRRLTPFMSLLGALALSLWKWTEQQEMVIGTVVAGRNRSEFENVLGCFMNYLPLHLRLRPGMSGLEFLEHVRSTVIAAQSHQECPFEKIVEAAGAVRNQARNPLFNVALLWHNYPPGSFAPPNTRTEPVEVSQQTALLDLRFEAEPFGEEWRMACEYDTALFQAREIASLVRTYARAFEFLVQMPEKLLQEFAPAESKPNGFLPAFLARLQPRLRKLPRRGLPQSERAYEPAHPGD